MWDAERSGELRPAQPCSRCGKSCRGQGIVTLFDDEVVCPTCAEIQRNRCGGKVTSGKRAITVPGASGKRHST